MELIVLGGSAASPNTGMGCSGYLVRSADTAVLIDPGPGTLQELRRYTDFRRLSGVVVSHMHLDHCLDLLALRHALAYNPIAAPAPIPVWLPPGGSAFLERLAAPFDECDSPGTFTSTIEVSEYEPDRVLTIGDLEIRFAPGMHFLPSWAMRISDSYGKAIGYTGDTGPSAKLAELFAGVQILLAEATLTEPLNESEATRRSLSAAEAAGFAVEAGAGELVLTHYWEENNPDTERTAAQAIFSGRVTLARPGVRIAL